jgi:hypothetical protein
MKRALLAGVLLAAGITTSACGGDAACTSASALNGALSAKMTGGIAASGAQAVKDASRGNVWIVAVNLNGPGASGSAAFAVNSLTAPTQVFSVNSVAKAISTWPDGAAQGFSSTDAAVGTATGCL